MSLQRVAGLVTSSPIMSNILKTEAAQTKLSAAQTSTNEAQTNETIVGNVEHVGGLSDLRNGHQYYFNILENRSSTNENFHRRHKPGTNGAQTNKTILREFGACGGLSDVIAYISMSNILKTEAAQTKILTAQTQTNEAQTIEPVLGEFGSMWGGLVTSSAYNSMSNIY